MLKKLHRLLARQTEPTPVAHTSTSGFTLASTLHGHMLTHPNDRVIGESLRRDGRFAEQDIDLARRRIADLGVTLGDTIFLDIGANIGTHTIHALKSGFARGACIEPDPDNFKLLRINQILNDVDERCVNIFAAASDTDGTGALEISPTNFGDHRIRTGANVGAGVHAEENWSVRQVKVGRLQTLMAQAGISLDDISLVWIDTQGHEGHIFRGCPALLTSKIPVVCEFWPYGLDRSGSWRSYRDALLASGREIYDLRRELATARKPVSANELEDMFAAMIAKESLSGSPHTDLLLI